MKKSIFSFTAVSMLLTCTCTLQLPADTTHIQGGIGYRQDSIKLKVKERSSMDPRAKSDRHFKDLEIFLLGAKLKTTLGSYDTYIRGSFDYGFVLDGKLRDQLTIEDREFSLHHHSGHITEGEYLRSTIHNDIKSNSFVWDIDLAFAYPFKCYCDGLEIAPAIGFSIDRQQLRVKGHKANSQASISIFEIDAFDLAKTHGLKSSFRGEWWGPWLGFDFAYDFFNCWALYGSCEFHVGRARRKIRSHEEKKSIVNFNRTETFYGPLFKLGASYIFCANWYADGNISYWKYFSDKSRNHLSWSAASIHLDVGYVF